MKNKDENADFGNYYLQNRGFFIRKHKTMKEYLYLIIILAAVLDLLSHFSAERFKDISTAALGLILTLAILLPLPGLYKKISGEIKFSTPEISQGEDICLAAFEEGIVQYVSDRWELEREDLEVETIGFSREEMRAEKIIISLHGKAALSDYKRIEKELSELGLGEVEVKIEI